MTRSAYPQAVEDLLPRAQDMAEQSGEVPSLNRLKAELHIGTVKARALRDALTPADDTPALAVSTLASPLPSTPEHTPAETVTNVTATRRPVVVWPVVLLAMPAFVAVWSGWVGLGELTGFGVMHPLPGIWDGLSINTAITLPIGVETYAAYALYVALSGRVPRRARRFAAWSAVASLLAGALGQVAYHLLNAAGVTHAPWPVTTAVACLPVAVLGMGAALAHLVRSAD